MKIKLDELLSKEVSRKEFLQYAGFALLAVTGFSGIVKNLQHHTVSQKTAGYGALPYGGAKSRLN